MTDMVKLGQFEVTSGKLRVTDPCYDRSIWCSGYVDAENGTWEAFVYMSDQGAWGNRVSALEVRRVGENEAPDRLVSFEVAGDPVQSYRNYYKGAKKHLHKYTNREMPEWMK